MIELEQEIKDKLERNKNDSFLHFENNLFQEYNKELELRLEFILRHCVTPPIKGPITKGKIKRRGIKVEHKNYFTYDIGYKPIYHQDIIIYQRGKIVKYDKLDYKLWKNYKLTQEESVILGNKK